MRTSSIFYYLACDVDITINSLNGTAQTNDYYSNCWLVGHAIMLSACGEKKDGNKKNRPSITGLDFFLLSKIGWPVKTE